MYVIKFPESQVFIVSINGLVVEFIVAIDEARVRFTVDANQLFFRIFILFIFPLRSMQH